LIGNFAADSSVLAFAGNPIIFEFLFGAVIAKLPPQVAERQSPETDYVSGATQSTNAFYYAVVEALSKAK